MFFHHYFAVHFYPNRYFPGAGAGGGLQGFLLLLGVGA
jgi:hypothetical protein